MLGVDVFSAVRLASAQSVVPGIVGDVGSDLRRRPVEVGHSGTRHEQ